VLLAVRDAHVRWINSSRAAVGKSETRHQLVLFWVHKLSCCLLQVLTLVFAGHSEPKLAWSLVEPQVGSPLPSGRQEFGMGYDAVRNRLIVFGGSGG